MAALNANIRKSIQEKIGLNRHRLRNASGVIHRLLLVYLSTKCLTLTMNKKHMFWIIPVVLLSAFTLSGPIMSDVEQAKYTVVQTDDDFEIRDYAASIAAEVEVSGERKEAISEGFKMIADYIFGNNKSSDKVAMTAPVIQEQSQSIDMSAPVIQEGHGKSWKVRFIMPSHYTLETLPKPNNTSVKIVELPTKRFAVVRFSGVPDNDDLKAKTEQLTDWLKKQNLKTTGKPIYAFYNPPWTLPFLRRNEVLVEISAVNDKFPQ